MKTDSFNFFHVPGLPGLELVKGVNVTHSFPRHAHRNYCIGIIDKGCRSYFSKGTTNYIAAGGTLWINPDEVHTCNTIDGKGHSYRMLCLEVNYFHQLLVKYLNKKQNTPLYFRTKITENTCIYKALTDLFTLLEASASTLEKESKLLATLGVLSQGQDYMTVFPHCNESRAITLIREYLETNYMENVSIDQLTKMTGLSPSYLIRLFGKDVGLSPHNFQSQIRIKQAKFKLLQGGSIIDIALETGFTDQSHFTRFFKRMIGVTPGEYVHKHTN
jgi:AraC-like DNA-binding protein